MRRALPALAVASLFLAGCGQELSPEEQAVRDERDIAMVERANEAGPPVREISPDPILLPDVERYDLFGHACNYAPGTSLGTRVIARDADAWMKINGDMVRFAADSGSRELPGKTRSLYSAKEYALQLALSEKKGTRQAAPAAEDAFPAETTETTDYEGSVTLRDAWGRVVYEGSGLAQCGS